MTKSPDAFRTISEVAEALETPAHVLRFWESRFPQIRPVKRAGGRRYYRPADVALLTGIKRLLHDDGLTIRGVQKILREQGVRFVSGVADDLADEDGDAALVAALALASPQGALPVDLPPAAAETAQIIALQTALRLAPADGPDHSDRTDSRRDPAPPVQTIAMTPAPVVADLFARLDPPAAVTPPPEPDAIPDYVPDSVPDPVPEAPMTLWAEDNGPADPVPSAPLLHFSRVGPTNPPAPPDAAPERKPELAPDLAPELTPELTPAPTMAQRLRALRHSDLAASDRMALADLHAQASVLHARLIAAIGPASGPAGPGRFPT